MVSAWTTTPPSRMQLQGSLLVYGLLAASNTLAAVHRVDHSDTSVINYIPDTCDLDCTRVCRNRWWVTCLSNGGASHRTKGNNTQASFTFRGSSITWYSRTGPDGGKASVLIDGVFAAAVDTASPAINEAYPMFSRSGLDPSNPHTIHVVYDVNAFVDNIERFVDVRYFEYEDGGTTPGTSAGPVVVGGSTTTSPSSSATQSSNSGATTATSSSTSGSHASTSGISTSSTTGSSRPNETTITLSGPSGLIVSVASVQSAAVGNINQAGGGAGGNDGGKGVPVSALVGFALGIVLIGALIALGWWWRRRRRRRRVMLNPFTESKEEINRPPDLSIQPVVTQQSADADSIQQYEMRIPEKLRRQHPTGSPYGADPFASTNSLGDGPFSSRRNLAHQNQNQNQNQNSTSNVDINRGDGGSSSNIGSGTMNTPSSPTTENGPRTPIHHTHTNNEYELVSPNPTSPLPEGTTTLMNLTSAPPTAVEKRPIATATPVSPFDSLDNTATSTGVDYLSPERRRAVERSSLGTSYRTPTPPPEYVR